MSPKLELMILVSVDATLSSSASKTQYAQQINMPMENGEDGDIPDEGDALLDNNDNNQNNY